MRRKKSNIMNLMRSPPPQVVHAYKDPFNRSKRLETGLNILSAYGQYDDFVKESNQYIKDSGINPVKVPKMNSFSKDHSRKVKAAIDKQN